MLFALAAPLHAVTEEEIAQATRLLEAGRLDEAQALVRRLRAEPSPPLQVLFLSGMIQLQQGRYEQAAEEFRLMLTRDPTLLRPRLELARALFLARDYAASLYNFEQVLAAPLPENVRANVLAYVTQIRDYVPRFAVSLEFIADSNPKQATASENVQIGGRLYRLNPDAQARSAQGVVLTAQGRVPLPEDPSLFLTGYLETYDYSGRDLDFSYVQVLAGKHLNFGPNGVDLQLGGHYAAYQGNDLYDGITWRVTDFLRLRQNLTCTLSVDARSLNYRNYSYLNGWQYVGGAELRYAVTPASSLRGGLLLLQGNARDEAFSFSGYALSARYTHEWAGGWIGSVSTQYARYDFDAADPFFAQVRADRESRVEATLTSRRLIFRGFLPTLTLGYVERDSNIELYAFNRTFVRLGITREF